MATSIPLRPRGVSELVDAAFQLLKRDYLQHVLIVALPMVPWFAASMFYTQVMGIDLTDPDITKIPRSYWVLNAVAAPFLYMLMEGAIAVGVSDAYFGRTVDVWSAHGRAFARLPSLIAATFLRNLAIFVGLILLILPSLWVAARYLVTVPALLLEDLGPLKALGRSSELTKGEMGRIFKALLLMFVLYLGFTIAITMATTALLSRSPAMAQVVSAIAQILVLPLFGAIQTLLYYDLRIRKEGFDIEVMSRALAGSPADQPA
jgi:hypothetical protein